MTTGTALLEVEGLTVTADPEGARWESPDGRESFSWVRGWPVYVHYPRLSFALGQRIHHPYDAAEEIRAYIDAATRGGRS